MSVGIKICIIKIRFSADGVIIAFQHHIVIWTTPFLCFQREGVCTPLFTHRPQCFSFCWRLVQMIRTGQAAHSGGTQNQAVVFVWREAVSHNHGASPGRRSGAAQKCLCWDQTLTGGKNSPSAVSRDARLPGKWQLVSVEGIADPFMWLWVFFLVVCSCLSKHVFDHYWSLQEDKNHVHV